MFLLFLQILIAQPQQHEDCLSYNPETLTVVPQSSGLWLLTDGAHRMQPFGSKVDAENGLALAQRYSARCFIGRHPSVRPNITHQEYLRTTVTYWKSPTASKRASHRKYASRIRPDYVV